MSAEIVLTTINARFAHASLGLRCLAANLGPWRGRAELCEFILTDRPLDMAEAILARAPRLVGLGVYVWNARQSLELVRILRRLDPALTIVLGGPEVSFEAEAQEICALADHVIAGEGELALRALCDRLLGAGEESRPAVRLDRPALTELAMPYHLYCDADLAHRVTYVEASRGCPFGCQFCLAALDRHVRTVPLEPFLAELQQLLDRGARHLKFVDRTFNLAPARASAILRFCAERATSERFFHFEMVPDHLPEEIRAALRSFPAGSLQLELGVQTMNPATVARIGRRQDYERLAANLRWLRAETEAHLHADLIIGLPGESVASFGRGFDQLIALGPDEIQVGILKRLRGAAISVHDDRYGMRYNPNPPYDLMASGELSFPEMQELKRFARAWDLVGNSGNFLASVGLIWGDDSPFAQFRAFTAWLRDRVGPFTGIALTRLARLVLTYLVEERGLAHEHAGAVLARDYARPGRRLPGFLAELVPPPAATGSPGAATPRRQARHLGTATSSRPPRQC